MLDVHIDDFFKDCAVILLHGFRYFPAKQILYVEDICGPDKVDEFGLHSTRHIAAFGAIVWLQEEGYIRFSDINRQESVDEFVLTSKAFTLLLHSENNSTATRLAQRLEFELLQGNSSALTRLMHTQFIGDPT